MAVHISWQDPPCAGKMSGFYKKRKKNPISVLNFRLEPPRVRWLGVCVGTWCLKTSLHCGCQYKWRHICRCRRCKQQKVSEGDRQETLQWISGHFICCCGWFALLSAVMSLGMSYKPNLNAQLHGNHGAPGKWTFRVGKLVWGRQGLRPGWLGRREVDGDTWGEPQPGVDVLAGGIRSHPVTSVLPRRLEDRPERAGVPERLWGG